MGGSPYLVSKIIPQREGLLFFFQSNATRAIEQGRPETEKGLPHGTFRRTEKAPQREARNGAFDMSEDVP